MANKKSFIVYYDKREMLEELLKTDSDSLSYERVGRLFMALIDFAEYGESNIALDGMTKVAYLSCVPQMQNDKDKYQAVVNRNRVNGAKGGRPTKNPNNPNGYYKKPKKPNKTQQKPKTNLTKPKKTKRKKKRKKKKKRIWR